MLCCCVDVVHCGERGRCAGEKERKKGLVVPKVSSRGRIARVSGPLFVASRRDSGDGREAGVIMRSLAAGLGEMLIRRATCSRCAHHLSAKSSFLTRPLVPRDHGAEAGHVDRRGQRESPDEWRRLRTVCSFLDLRPAMFFLSFTSLPTCSLATLSLHQRGPQGRM